MERHMTEIEGHIAGWQGYRALSLVDNPFRMPKKGLTGQPGVSMTTRAAGLRLISAIEEALASERPRPVRVLKSSKLPAYYPRSAMTTVLREFGTGSETELLPVYVQLILMRKGRIRGTLSALAELVVARSIDTTIARYARSCLEEADTSLPEWQEVEALDVADLIAAFEAEPEATVARIFGEPVEVREDSEQGLPEIMRDTGIRQVHQPVDPQEDDDTSEEDAADRLAAMASESEEGVVEPVEVESPEEAASREALAVVKYVIAHVRKHTSPVLARGLKAYVNSGTAAMVQELKITRAPRKTLGVLARFAGLTFRSVVIVYDGFEAWDDIPDDLRATIVSGLSEIRLALGQNGVIVIAGSDAEAPEIDEQFATAIRVDWDMPELARVEELGTAYDADLLEGWLRSAALPGGDVSTLWERVERVCSGSDDLASGLALAAQEVDKAANEALS
jgi:hypothetical protein